MLFKKDKRISGNSLVSIFFLKKKDEFEYFLENPSMKQRTIFICYWFDIVY